MKIKITRQTIQKYIYTILAIAISVFFSVLLLESLYRFVKVRAGLISAAAVFAMVVFGILELSYLLAAGEIFKRAAKRYKMPQRFLVITATFGGLFALLKIFELWTFVPNPLDWIRNASVVWRDVDFAFFFGGLVVGAGSLTAALRLRRRDHI